MKVLVAERIGDSMQLLRDAPGSTSSWAWAGRREARTAHRRFRRAADPLGHAARRGPARARRQAQGGGPGGGGVDNVDVEAATKRGVVVANAPQSNVITAAEHTMAMLLALARKVPQAHGSLTGGAWERSKFSGVELYEKTLGVLGFGRIGQLVAHRALGFGMRVMAYDAYVAEERFRDVGVERAASSDDLYANADFLTIHLPVNEETENWLDAEAFAKMREGAGDQRRPRQADGRRGAARGARLGQGGRRGARRLSRRAGDRASAVRLSQRGGHPAPGPRRRRPPTAPATRRPSRWWPP